MKAVRVYIVTSLIPKPSKRKVSYERVPVRGFLTLSSANKYASRSPVRRRVEREIEVVW